MKASFWITLAVSAAVGIVALMMQAARNKGLLQRLAAEQTEPATKVGRDKARFPKADPGLSQERVDRALAEIGGLVPEDRERGSDDPTGALMAQLGREESYKKISVAFLRSVEGLSVDELLSVAAKTADPKFKKWLVLLAAEQDPARIYRDEELRGRISAEEMALALANRDPAAALAMLPPMKPRSPDEGSIYLMMGESNLETRINVATKSLGADLDLGLQTLLEIQDNLNGANNGRIPMGQLGSTGIPPLPEGSVPGIISAMGDPQYAAIREDLLRMTTTHLMFEGGVPAVVEQAESMQLTPEELQDTIKRMTGLGGMTSDPSPLMEWISEVQPGQAPSALLDWAELDLEGATTWLGAQEPSPVRDQTIARFAREASNLDPTAAAEWAREITDEALREKTLARIAEK